MRWSPSILVQVATLALTTLVLAFALSLSIVLLTPTPAPVRMTVRDAARILGGEQNGAFGLTIRSAPPALPRVAEVEASLARMLRVRPDRVRARWLNSDGAGKGKATGQSVILVGDRTLLVDSGAGSFRMRFGADVRIGPTWKCPRSKQPFVRTMAVGALSRRPIGTWPHGDGACLRRSVWPWCFPRSRSGSQHVGCRPRCAILRKVQLAATWSANRRFKMMARLRSELSPQR